jgi:phenylacetate-CoA ligase
MASSIHGIVWPALRDTTAASLAAVADELERTQWMSSAELRHRQVAQRDLLLAHAAASVPHYRGIDPRAWASVPVMTREAITTAGKDLLTRAYPSTHGPVEDVITSRTSGTPVRVKSTQVTGALWTAITLRDHAWHRRDLHAHLAAIRYLGTSAPPPDGVRARGWGAATARLAPDAPLSALSVASTTDEQVAWLVRENPTYLLVYPSVLHAIVRRLDETGQKLPALREVRTISEVLSPGTRGLVRDVLGVPIVDTYSAQEVGYIALQCPDHEHYHVQMERLIVEILRDDGTACEPGEIGRVVVTDLHNFATPILRYELGDYAEVGPPCPCGRGLPVLTRIVGRLRNMLVYPDGSTRWPVFTGACRAAARYRELQVVQLARDTLRLRVVPDGELDRPALVAALQSALGFPFQVEVEIVEAISRSPAGKLEELVSHVRPG